MKKNLNLPWLDPLWLLYQLICTLALGHFPFPLGSILAVETLVACLAFRFEWIKLRPSRSWHILFGIHMIVVVNLRCC